MQTTLNPYLSFRDGAREAMEFYKTIFGGKLDVTTFKGFNASQDPGEDNKVMHARLEASNGMVLMGADTPNAMELHAGTNVSLSLSGDNEDELRTYYNKLSDGGTNVLPMNKAPWGDIFGMCTDKFGINWLVNVTVPKT